MDAGRRPKCVVLRGLRQWRGICDKGGIKGAETGKCGAERRSSNLEHRRATPSPHGSEVELFSAGRQVFVNPREHVSLHVYHVSGLAATVVFICAWVR